MTIGSLKELAARLLVGPALTTEKKLYAFSGPIQILRDAIPGPLLIDSNILDAFNPEDINIPEDKLRELIPRRLSIHLAQLQEPRRSSIVILREAMILYRYRILLTFLYELVGDARAIVLHYPGNQPQQFRAFPSYVRFDPGEVARFFENGLGPQCLTA
jgi:hypothetical protein